MMKTAIVYSFKTTRTRAVAEAIAVGVSGLKPEMIDVDHVHPELLFNYDLIVAGVPTWFDGELPFYWDEWMPELETLDLTGKKVAVFGLGDQLKYPENFADAVGIFADFAEKRGATIVGKTSIDGFSFNSSKAVRENEFLGLVLDDDNQSDLTANRIENWCSSLVEKL